MPFDRLLGTFDKSVGIELTQGQFSYIDAEDIKRVEPHSWYAMKDGKSYYAASSIWDGNTWRVVRLHRFLLNAPKWLLVDHIDHDTLNNQKYNLRLCTRAQNAMNQRAKDGRSKGVYFQPSIERRGKIYQRTRPWVSVIGVGDKQLYLGSYLTKTEAVTAYNAAAIEHFGEFASVNT